MPPHFLELFDAEGQPHGVWLGPELWDRVKDHVLPLLREALGTADASAAPVEKPEPLADWETLLAYWDFAYPPDFDVTCAHCGAGTEDWTKDTPRQFRLRAANLGGLVTFQCQACRALVLKKHFKKHITVECQPYVERG
jgi:hypothetical protein